MGQISGLHVLLVLLEILGGVPLYVCVRTLTHICARDVIFLFFFFWLTALPEGRRNTLWGSVFL